MKHGFQWLREQSIQGMITGEQIKQFCKEQRDVLLNIPMHTMGGESFWDSVEIDGWKVQQHKLTGHCRILNPKNVRKAWGTEKQIMHPFSRYIQEQQRSLQVADKRYGIVFSGGGGKGAYQIGVWKYLNELGLDRQITGVSGSSVGALNSLLFVNRDLTLAEQTWLHIRQEDMIAMDLLKVSPGWCTMDRLKGIIDRTPLGWDRILAPNLLIYSTLSRSSWMHPKKTKVRGPADLWRPFTRAEYRCWAGLDPVGVRKVVLASAALPIVYGERHIKGRVYLDGGIQDNIPVRPLVRAGYENIIVVHLSRKRREDGGHSWKRAVKHLDCSGTIFFHVWPGADFDDSLEATLKVNPKLTEKRIALGYRDAKAQLNALAERM